MAEPTSELILRTLQLIQETLAEHARFHQEHARRFDKIDRALEDLGASTATALGFAMHANIRHEGVNERLEEVNRRVGSLDDLKRRVEQLEQAK